MSNICAKRSIKVQQSGMKEYFKPGRLLRVIAAVCATMVSGSQAVADVVIHNGSFHTGDFTDWNPVVETDPNPALAAGQTHLNFFYKILTSVPKWHCTFLYMCLNTCGCKRIQN